MVPIADSPPTTVVALVDEDHMTLSLQTSGESGVSAEEIRYALRAAGVPLEGAMEQLPAQLTVDGPFMATEPLVVMRGTAPVDDVPAAIEVLCGPEAADDLAPVDHYARNPFVLVQAEQELATIVEYERGQDGLDVLGQALARRREIPAQVVLGKNTQMAPDGKTVLAKSAGRLNIERLKISVEPQLQFAGDIDFSVGNLNFDGDIAIGGDVLDLFKVKAAGQITIGGMVEAAEVAAGHNVTVHGGIVCKEKGRVTAGGTLSAKFITNAHAEAGGDVLVRREIANSRVIAGGKIAVEMGPLMGGHATALGAISCQALGSASHVLTLVEAGVDQRMRTWETQIAPALDKKLQEAAALRQSVATLARIKATLPSKQKAHVNQTIGLAEEKEEQVHHEVEAWKERLRALETMAEAEPPLEVVVQAAIHAGVTLRIGMFETVFKRDERGPLKAVLRPGEEGPTIVLVNLKNATTQVADTRPATDKELVRFKAWLEGPHAV